MASASRVCAICHVRRPRRYCPGVAGDICPICCGTEREVTVNCPLDCPYLQESRRHQAPPDIDPKAIPNADIKIDERFLQRAEPLLILLSAAVARAALENSSVVDGDVREALQGLVRTYRTLHSGLVYEARPDNPLASRVYSGVQDAIANIRQRLEEHGGLRDADVLGVLAFLERLEMQHNNGRPKGRAYIDFLRQFMPPEHPKPGGSLIEVP